MAISSVIHWSDLIEKFSKTLVTIGLVLVLFKSPFVQLTEAETADEVLGMEFLAHRRYASPRNRLVASRTEAPPLLVVMGLAVGGPVVVEE